MNDKIKKAAEKIVETWIALPRTSDYEQAVKFVEKEIRKVVKK